MEILALGAAIAGILGFLYLLIFGQKSIPEWLLNRKTAKSFVEPKKDIEPSIFDSQSIVLHNLPPRGDFVERKKEKEQIHEALKSRSSITMIDGIGGIGKTSLALEVLHECLDASSQSITNIKGVQKFNAFIWTSAKDHGLTINDVLDSIARTLEYPSITQLPFREKQHEIFKRLREKKCLLIVDNFETVTDNTLYEFIQLIPEPSKCLITSRTQSLRQARSVSIRGLEEEKALFLIKSEGKRLGLNIDALVEDKYSFLRFYKATGGAPLAIRWSIGQIKQRGQSFDGVLDSLYRASGDIFEFIFERAWSLLSKSAAEILKIMPVFAAAASIAAIQAASNINKRELDEALGQLVELWLLEANEELDQSKRRYSLHPLTKAFARNKLSANLNLEHQARTRLAEFLERFAKDAGGDRYRWERYDEIEEEKDNIFALIDWCFHNGEPTLGMRLTRSISFFMNARNYLHEAFAFGRNAVDAARKEGESDILAWLLVEGIGWRETHGGDSEKGIAMIREGLRIYEGLKDSQGIISALRNLGSALRFNEEIDDARQCLQRGMALAECSADKLDVISFKRQFALLAVSEGKLIEAKNGLESILPILQEQSELEFIEVLGNLADINRRLGDYDTAFKIGSKGLELARKMKRRASIVWISQILAYTEKARGNHKSAISFAQQFLEDIEKTGFKLSKIDMEIQKMKKLIKELQENQA